MFSKYSSSFCWLISHGEHVELSAKELAAMQQKASWQTLSWVIGINTWVLFIALRYLNNDGPALFPSPSHACIDVACCIPRCFRTWHTVEKKMHEFSFSWQLICRLWTLKRILTVYIADEYTIWVASRWFFAKKLLNASKDIFKLDSISIDGNQHWLQRKWKLGHSWEQRDEKMLNQL